MQKPVLAIDIDEVLFPFVEELTRYYNVQHGADVKPEDYVVYEFRKIWNMTSEQVAVVVDGFLAMDHRGDVEPLPEAKRVLRRLREKYRLIVLTSRDNEFEEQAKAWLDHNFPDYFDEVVMVGNRFTGKGFMTKVEVCVEMGVTALIDDSLHYAAECAKKGIPALLFGDYPWNRSEPLPELVRRVRDWAEVERVLE